MVFSMIDRLDNQCRARILSVSGDEVIIAAYWPAKGTDRKFFQVYNDTARNIVCVSRGYFERRYGVKL